MPPEIDPKIREHDNAIAEIYAKLVTLEHRADDIRFQMGAKFDRIETRLQGVEVAAETPLGDLGDRLDGVGAQLDDLGVHLTGIDIHLAALDAALLELMQLVPKPA